jgi:hypothetical protein
VACPRHAPALRGPLSLGAQGRIAQGHLPQGWRKSATHPVRVAPDGLLPAFHVSTVEVDPSTGHRGLRMPTFELTGAQGGPLDLARVDYG